MKLATGLGDLSCVLVGADLGAEAVQLLAGVGDPFAGGGQLCMLRCVLRGQRLFESGTKLPDAEVICVGTEI